MEKRKHKRQKLIYTGLDTVNISFIKPETLQSLGKRSYLWDLSCSGGCVCCGESVSLNIGQLVTLRAHDHIHADEHFFDAVVRWIDHQRFGFEFGSKNSLNWINLHLPEACPCPETVNGSS